MLIDVSKQRGGKIAHQIPVDRSLRHVLPEISISLRKELLIIGGIAFFENHLHQTIIIVEVAAD